MLWRRYLLAGVILGLLCPLVVYARALAPVKITDSQKYERGENDFAAAFVMDVGSGEVLYEYEADKVWPAASLTKLAASMVFMNNRPAWSKVVSLRQTDEVGGGRLRVNAGARLRVIDLLYSSLTGSANNAAMAMARVSGLGQNGFIKAMNRKAKVLGLKKTIFVDPTGISPKNMSTARDLARLANEAYKVDMIRRTATTGHYRFIVRNTGQLKDIKNTNDLLLAAEHEDVVVTGGKTGFLYESMYNLAVRIKPVGAKWNDRHIVVVVLGAPTREDSFKSAKGLAKWAWESYSWDLN